MKKAKVQIIETSNKNIKVGDKFKVNIFGEKSRGTNGVGRTTDGTGGGGKRKPKQPSLRDIVVQFIERQEQFNTKQEQFNNEVVSFIKNQEQFNNEQKEFNSAIITTLQKHGEAIVQLNGKVDKIDEKVDNVIKLNNLKS